MKKLILVCGLASGLASAGLAQPTHTVQPVQKHHHHKNQNPEEAAKKHADRAQKDLGLSSSQKDQWQAASLKMMNANKPYWDKLSGSTTPEERMELRKLMKVNKENFDKDVTAFLSPDQKTKRDELKSKRKEHHHRGMKDKSPKPERE